MFGDYGILLKQAKAPPPFRVDVMEFDVQTNTKESEKNIKLQSCPSDYSTRPKRWSNNTGRCFVMMDSIGLSGDLHSILTQVDIHLSSVKHLATVLMSLR